MCIGVVYPPLLWFCLSINWQSDESTLTPGKAVRLDDKPVKLKEEVKKPVSRIICYYCAYLVFV